MQTNVYSESGADARLEGSSGMKSETVDRIASSAHQTVDRIAERADGALQSLRDSAWKETGDQSLERVQGYVRENPLMALGLALAVGILISRVIR
jgi:ElaB/YqjD/DUF883 family membrane-anchored ribosome-binding protein